MLLYGVKRCLPLMLHRGALDSDQTAATVVGDKINMLGLLGWPAGGRNDFIGGKVTSVLGPRSFAVRRESSAFRFATHGGGSTFAVSGPCSHLLLLAGRSDGLRPACITPTISNTASLFGGQRSFDGFHRRLILIQRAIIRDFLGIRFHTGGKHYSETWKEDEFSQPTAKPLLDVLQVIVEKPKGNNGGRTRTRTLDPLIKSQLLYQLSYAP